MNTGFIPWKAKPCSISGFFFSFTQIVEIFTRPKSGQKPLIPIGPAHTLYSSTKVAPASSSYHGDVVA